MSSQNEHTLLHFKTKPCNQSVKALTLHNNYFYLKVPCLWVSKWKADISEVASTSKSFLKDFFSNQLSLQDQPFHLEARECTVVTSVRKEPRGWHHHSLVREDQVLKMQKRVRC